MRIMLFSLMCAASLADRPAAGAVEGPFFCCGRFHAWYKPRRPRHRGRAIDAVHAGVAELVDALDLGSRSESCGGSSPSARTKRFSGVCPKFHGAPLLRDGDRKSLV